MAAISDVSDIAAKMLFALSTMAAHSVRNQAELGTALHRAGLRYDAIQVQAALGLLQAERCVSNLVALADGGLLLTVTGHAMGNWASDSHFQEA